MRTYAKFNDEIRLLRTYSHKDTLVRIVVALE